MNKTWWGNCPETVNKSTYQHNTKYRTFQLSNTLYAFVRPCILDWQASLISYFNYDIDNTWTISRSIHSIVNLLHAINYINPSQDLPEWMSLLWVQPIGDRQRTTYINQMKKHGWNTQLRGLHLYTIQDSDILAWSWPGIHVRLLEWKHHKLSSTLT